MFRFIPLFAIVGVLMAQRPVPKPVFEVDPKWPKMPAKFLWGVVSGVAVDSKDHIWVLHRPATLAPEEKGDICCVAAPPVVEFDQAGNYVQGWGGPGDESFEQLEHTEEGTYEGYAYLPD